ncbi:MAG: PAP/fibrillin family protein [Prochlorothrix sp.]
MLNRLTLKQTLIETIAEQQQQQKIAASAPVTDNKIATSAIQEIEALTTDLEQQTLFPRPLLYSPNLLQGTWKLLYSSAREIRMLTRLPLGFQVGGVYQVIDVPSATFFNQAFCYHALGILAGYVKVTAEFKLAPSEGDGQPDQRVDVFFQKRFLFLEQAFSLNLPFQQPLQAFDARNPPGRQPFLKITYLDEDFRVGRGGEGSLFILSRVQEMTR